MATYGGECHALGISEIEARLKALRRKRESLVVGDSMADRYDAAIAGHEKMLDECMVELATRKWGQP